MSVFRPKYRERNPETGELGPPKESTVWWCDFGFAGRRYREPTKETLKTLAVEYEKRRRRELEEAHARGPQAKHEPGRWLQTVAAALKAYRARFAGGREKTSAWINERTAHVERLLGTSLLLDLTEDKLRGYIRTRLGEGAGNRTVNMEAECLSRALGRTWRDLWPTVRRLEEPEDVGRALSLEEEQAILAAAAKNKSPQVEAFIRVALMSCMRCGEIRTLQVGRIDFHERTLRVGRAKTRTGTGRVIPLNQDLCELLARQVDWLREHFGAPRPDWYLFPFSDRVKPIDPTRPITSIKSAWGSVRAVAGVACRFHDLRHTAITKLAEKGVPDSTMKAIAGHVHEKMLERYSHIRMAAKREAVEALALPAVVNQNPNAKGNAKVARKRRLFVMSKTAGTD